MLAPQIQQSYISFSLVPPTKTGKSSNLPQNLPIHPPFHLPSLQGDPDFQHLLEGLVDPGRGAEMGDHCLRGAQVSAMGQRRLSPRTHLALSF